jgi:biopolymer transport protein ExbD
MSKFKGPDVEESVACNLIPMIDIMFLLLLFFMLGADMSQRELEEVELPKADQVKEEPKVNKDNTRRVNVNIYHTHTNTGSNCEKHESGQVCRDMTHWAIAIGGNRFTLENIKQELLELAALDLEDNQPTDPKAVKLSKVEVMIRADQNAPYQYIQRVIETCGGVGLYKIAVGAAQPEGKGGATPVATK